MVLRKILDLPPGIFKMASATSFYGVIILLVIGGSSILASKLTAIYFLAMAVSSLLSNWLEQSTIRFQDDVKVYTLSFVLVLFSLSTLPYFIWLLLKPFGVFTVILCYLLASVDAMQRVQMNIYLYRADGRKIFNSILIKRIIFEILGCGFIFIIFKQDLLNMILLIALFSRLFGFTRWKIISGNTLHILRSNMHWLKYGLPVTILSAFPALYSANIISSVAISGKSAEFVNAVRIFSLLIPIPVGIQMVELAPEIFNKIKSKEELSSFLLKKSPIPLIASIILLIVSVFLASFYVSDVYFLILIFNLLCVYLWGVTLYVLKFYEFAHNTAIPSAMMGFAVLLSMLISRLFPELEKAVLINLPFAIFFVSILISKPWRRDEN